MSGNAQESQHYSSRETGLVHQTIGLSPISILPTLSTGILTGCGQKWGIMRHYKGQLCGKKDQLCGKLCGSQFLISNVLGGGVLNGVLIGILVYLSDGINIST